MYVCMDGQIDCGHVAFQDVFYLNTQGSECQALFE